MPACDKGRFPATDVLRELREAGTPGPAGSAFLIRHPSDVLESHRREGWGRADVFAVVESASKSVRVIMADGRSGNVVWDRVPNDALHVQPGREAGGL